MQHSAALYFQTQAGRNKVLMLTVKEKIKNSLQTFSCPDVKGLNVHVAFRENWCHFLKWVKDQNVLTHVVPCHASSLQVSVLKGDWLTLVIQFNLREESIKSLLQEFHPCLAQKLFWLISLIELLSLSSVFIPSWSLFLIHLLFLSYSDHEADQSCPFLNLVFGSLFAGPYYLDVPPQSFSLGRMPPV